MPPCSSAASPILYEGGSATPHTNVLAQLLCVCVCAYAHEWVCLGACTHECSLICVCVLMFVCVCTLTFPRKCYSKHVQTPQGFLESRTGVGHLEVPQREHSCWRNVVCLPSNREKTPRERKNRLTSLFIYFYLFIYSYLYFINSETIDTKVSFARHPCIYTIYKIQHNTNIQNYKHTQVIQSNSAAKRSLINNVNCPRGTRTSSFKEICRSIHGGAKKLNTDLPNSEEAEKISRVSHPWG